MQSLRELRAAGALTWWRRKFQKWGRIVREQETRGLEEAGREVLYDTGRELETRHLSVGTLIFV
jgi:hypothetical protein